MNFPSEPAPQKTVLVLDYNEVARAQIIGRLSRMGLQGIGAGSFVELYDNLERADLLITEWQMEDFEGAALFRRLECESRPTVLFTARPLDPEAVAAWNNAGLKTAVTKPDRAHLMQEVVFLLSQ